MTKHNFEFILYKMEFMPMESVAASIIQQKISQSTAATPIDSATVPDPTTIAPTATVTDPTATTATVTDAVVIDNTVSATPSAGLTQAELAYLKPYLVDYVAAGVHA